MQKILMKSNVKDYKSYIHNLKNYVLNKGVENAK